MLTSSRLGGTLSRPSRSSSAAARLSFISIRYTGRPLGAWWRTELPALTKPASTSAGAVLLHHRHGCQLTTASSFGYSSLAGGAGLRLGVALIVSLAATSSTAALGI